MQLNEPNNLEVKFLHVPAATLFKAENIRRISVANRIDIGGNRHWVVPIDPLCQYQPG